MPNQHRQFSLEEMTRAGAKFYFDELKDKLEKENMDDYVVIDVEQKKYRVDPDRLAAIKKAQKDFGEKLFYIVHVGAFRKPSMNFNTQKYAWDFS